MNNKMKRTFKIVLVIMTMFILTGVTSFAASDIKLIIDDKEIETDVAPIIKEGRTLVPFRAFLEKLGAEVHWEEKASMATAILGNQRVQVTVNNKTAFVNGLRKELDVPAIIKDGRILMPARFVSENLNCIVGWDNDSRTVSIETPKKPVIAEIKEIKYEEKDGLYRIKALGANNNLNINSFSYDSPERFGVDIKNASLVQGIGSINATNEIIKGVRFSQFDDNTVRIVVDLNEPVPGRLSFSDENEDLYIDFGLTDEKSEENNQDVEEGEQEIVVDLPELDWKAKGKLVVIDPGHGGRDPGASGKINGKTVITEKELNLDIALRIKELLLAVDANVYLLREEDRWIELYERPEIANEMKADLFVSVHNNGYGGSTLPNGTEVLYYDKVASEDYGVTSKQLARYIQDQLIVRTGLKDRGIKNSPHLAVLNKSLMPAVIIEGGFLSNPSDLQVILTEEFKDGYAMSVAIGIVKSLNYWVENEKAP